MAVRFISQTEFANYYPKSYMKIYSNGEIDLIEFIMKKYLESHNYDGWVYISSSHDNRYNHKRTILVFVEDEDIFVYLRLLYGI